jgi:hypothetical protein
MELFPEEFVPELNTKNLGNSTRFLAITHMTLSAKRFREYKNLTIDVAAEFCSRTDQRQSGSSFSGLGLAKTPEVPNTILNGNSAFRWSIKWLQLVSDFELWQSETQPVAETTFLADHTYLYETGFWQNFTMTSAETSHTKNVANKLSFPLVTHMTHFDIRFGRYGILKLCFSSEHVQDRPDCIRSVRFLSHKMGDTC